MSVVVGFTLLLVCQLAGEVVARGTGVPVPGPVLGLAILLAGLHLFHWRARAEAGGGGAAPREEAEGFDGRGIAKVSDGLLANLSLLFVPAGVGIVDQLGLLEAQALPIVLALAVSTVLTMLATVGVFLLIKRMLGRRADPAP